MRLLAALGLALALLGFSFPASAQSVNSPSILSGLNAVSTAPIIANSLPATCTVNVAGTFSGTLVFEVSGDNANWYGISMSPVGGTLPVSSVSAPNFLQAPCAFQFFRVRMSAYASGSATVIITLTPQSGANSVATVQGINNGTAIATSLSAAGLGGTSATPVTVQLCDPGVPICFTAALVNGPSFNPALRVSDYPGYGQSTIASGVSGACTSFDTTAPITLDSVQYVSASAQTGFLTIYNEGGSPSCNAADAIYIGSLTRAASVIPDTFGFMGLHASNGLAYKWTTTAEVGNVLIGWH